MLVMVLVRQYSPTSIFSDSLVMDAYVAKGVLLLSSRAPDMCDIIPQKLLPSPYIIHLLPPDIFGF